MLVRKILLRCLQGTPVFREEFQAYPLQKDIFSSLAKGEKQSKNKSGVNEALTEMMLIR